MSFAYLAQDPVMIEVFKANQDIHVRTGRGVCLPLEMVTPEMRQLKPKFWDCLRISDYGLSRDLFRVLRLKPILKNIYTLSVLGLPKSGCCHS